MSRPSSWSGAQLGERHAVGDQAPQELGAMLASLALEPVEEALGLDVDLLAHGAQIVRTRRVSRWRRRAPRASASRGSRPAPR